MENPKGYGSPSQDSTSLVEGWGEGGRNGVDQEDKEKEFMSQYIQFSALNQNFQCFRHLDIPAECLRATWSDADAVLGFAEGLSSGE